MQFLLTIFSCRKQKLKRSSPPRWKDPGNDPFKQNFQKSRSLTEFISSVQPEKFRKSRHFSLLGRSIENWAFHLIDLFLIPGPRGKLFMFNMDENTYHCGFCGLLTAKISLTRTSMCTYNTFSAASQTKCMFWLLKTVYSWENLECSSAVIRKYCWNSAGKYLGTFC